MRGHTPAHMDRLLTAYRAGAVLLVIEIVALVLDLRGRRLCPRTRAAAGAEGAATAADAAGSLRRQQAMSTAAHSPVVTTRGGAELGRLSERICAETAQCLASRTARVDLRLWLVPG